MAALLTHENTRIPIQSDRLFRLTTDNTPFSLGEVRQIGRGGWPFLTNEAVLPRNADGLEIAFSHPVDPASVRQAIRVTRQDGQDPGWQMAVQGRFTAVTPAISLAPVAAFNVKNTAFAVAPVVQNPTATAQVGIYQNGVKLFEGAPTADGSIPPVMAENSSLPDVVFSLKVTGTAAGSGNQGVHVTPLLVDRTGSFPDVPPTHWARRYVEAMHDLGIVNGRPGGGYAPADAARPPCSAVCSS